MTNIQEASAGALREIRSQELSPSLDINPAQVSPATEPTMEEKIDAIYRFVAQFGDLMENIQPVLAKLSEHPMIQAFLG